MFWLTETVCRLLCPSTVRSLGGINEQTREEPLLCRRREERERAEDKKLHSKVHTNKCDFETSEIISDL